METRITSFKELEAEAARFLSTLAPSSLGATLVTLSGELGAGKTAFVKAIALTLGVPDTVTSPTFVLEKIYVLPPNLPFKRLIHIDAYRLEKSNNLNALGFSELMKSSDNLVMLEWPEKVQDALPQPAAHLSFLANEDESRTITYG